jgi:cytochrome c5
MIDAMRNPVDRVLCAALLISSVSLSVIARAEQQTGRAIYEQGCIVCHGDDGQGAMPDVTPITGNPGPLFQADAVLLQKMMNGVQSDDASVAMPPKGGNPELTEDDLRRVLEYMRKQFGK